MTDDYVWLYMLCLEAYVGGAHDSGCGYKASYGGQWDQTYQGYGSEVTYDQTSGDNYYYGSAAADSSTNGYSGYSEEPPVGGYAEGSGGYGSFRGGSRGSGGRGTHGAVRGQGEKDKLLSSCIILLCGRTQELLMSTIVLGY